MSDQRLFFALWPSAEVRDQLHQCLEQGPSVKGRPHHPADLHMTLVFLGQVRAERITCIREAADSMDVQSFSLQIDHSGYWPRPKIVWAAPETTPHPLTRLVDDLKHRLTSCGFEPEQRPYRPHVTLYRKVPHHQPWRLQSAIQWDVNEFVLATSNNPGSNQNRYQILDRWPLQQSDNSQQ
ncbi:MAG: RNA 2',3'-cyclic phosphodiesterase [Candidatus Thiodiazotropha sp. 6PLUC2]